MIKRARRGTKRNRMSLNRHDVDRSTNDNAYVDSAMTITKAQPTWLRDELLHLLSLSGTLAGLSITGVALFHTIGKASISSTIADDVLALTALLFLLCTYAIFFALRTKRQALAIRLEIFIDALFAIALTGMVVAGFIMVYTVV